MEATHHSAAQPVLAAAAVVGMMPLVAHTTAMLAVLVEEPQTQILVALEHTLKETLVAMVALHPHTLSEAVAAVQARQEPLVLVQFLEQAVMEPLGSMELLTLEAAEHMFQTVAQVVAVALVALALVVCTQQPKALLVQQT